MSFCYLLYSCLPAALLRYTEHIPELSPALILHHCKSVFFRLKKHSCLMKRLTLFFPLAYWLFVNNSALYLLHHYVVSITIFCKSLCCATLMAIQKGLLLLRLMCIIKITDCKQGCLIGPGIKNGECKPGFTMKMDYFKSEYSIMMDCCKSDSIMKDIIFCTTVWNRQQKKRKTR